MATMNINFIPQTVRKKTKTKQKDTTIRVSLECSEGCSFALSVLFYFFLLMWDRKVKATGVDISVPSGWLLFE